MPSDMLAGHVLFLDLGEFTENSSSCTLKVDLCTGSRYTLS